MDIAILGMGVRMPLADDLKSFWSILKNGTCCVRDIPNERKEDYERYCKAVGINPPLYIEAAYLEHIDYFDNEFFGISPKEACIMDPTQRIFLETVWSAIEDAGYGGDLIRGTRTGVFVGYCGEQEYRNMVAEVEPSFLNMSVIGNCVSVIGGRISHILNLKGPNIMINTVCSSSLVAVHEACLSLQNNECEMAIVGGIQLHIIPKRKVKVGVESMDGRTRAFDDSADGTGCGEGAGALLLKPLEKALRDKDSIYAVIKGSAVNHDGHAVGISAPNPRAQEEVILLALNKAGVNPENVTYIEAHGTGTKLGDPVEIEGIKRAFARKTEKLNFCAIGSIKTNIGHLDGAAGIAGVIKAVLCLKNQAIVPSLFYEKANRHIDFSNSPVYVNTKLTRWETERKPRICGVSSFGFSGTNCHVIIEEWLEHIRECAEQEAYHLFVLSAQREEILCKLVNEYILMLEETSEMVLGDICCTAGIGRGHYKCRLAVIANSTQDLCAKLKQFIRNKEGRESDRYVFFSDISMKRTKDMLWEKNPEYILNSLMEIIERGERQWNSEPEFLRELAQLYIYGLKIRWDLIYSKTKYKKVNLPTYCFARKRCWLTPEVERSSTCDSNKIVYKSLEERISEIVIKVLGLEEISVDDDLIDLGADSIILIKIIEEIAAMTGIDFDLAQVVANPTVNNLVGIIKKKEEADV